MAMDLTKSYEFFKPENVNGRIHIIGCGSVGSTIAENLARCGVTKMTLWDFDKVEARNVSNQMFYARHIGVPKVDALKDILCEINADCAEDVQIQPGGWDGRLISGYVFLCVDSIEIRRDFVEKHMNSNFVKAVFDFRTLLTAAQHYAADWSSLDAKNYLLSTMQFSHEEAADETPVSACGVTLGVAPTVRVICALGVCNFINFVKGEGYKKFVQMDNFKFWLDEFDG